MVPGRGVHGTKDDRNSPLNAAMVVTSGGFSGTSGSSGTSGTSGSSRSTSNAVQWYTSSTKKVANSYRNY